MRGDQELMKVLFLYMNAYENTGIPIGLSYLIPILGLHKHQVELFETTFLKFNYSEYNIRGTIGAEGAYIIKSFQNRIDRFRPDVIAVSTTSLCFPFSIKVLESVNLSQSKVIYGGIHATVAPEDVLSHEVADYVCCGYSEETLTILLPAIEQGGNLTEIPNLVWRDEDGSLVYNPFKLPELSNLPIPDWDTFDERHLVRQFKERFYRWGNFQLTRGCPFSCRYCCNNFLNKMGNKVQHLPIEHVLDSMEYHANRYRLDIIRIFDETFGAGNMKEFQRFAEEYAKRINLPSVIETNPLVINEKVLGILKKINCISVSLGIEYGDQNKRLTIAGRNISDKRIETAFKLLRDNGIRTSSYNILNWPNDTRDDIFKLIDINRRCSPEYINTFYFTPFPGTELWDDCQKANLFKYNCVVDYGELPNIKNTNLTDDEIIGLRRTFHMYVHFEPELWPLLKLAEKNNKTGNNVFKCLTEILPERIKAVDVSDRLKTEGMSVKSYTKWRQQFT